MAFLIFERLAIGAEGILRPTSETYKLGGYNLIYEAWQQKGRPIDTGWHVTADELIRLHSGGAHRHEDRRLIIDFDPNATWRIGLVELLEIRAFTWGDGKGNPSWTPLMLRMQDVFYEEYDVPITPAQKVDILASLPEPESGASDFIEFLYLNGPEYGWNWGMNGMTKAVFLYGEARNYFRQFF
jgi:hypothetical protein